jgi:hypothetical protein
MCWGFIQAEHGRDAGVGAVEHPGPFITAALSEDLGEHVLARGPLLMVFTRRHCVRRQVEDLEEFGPEWALDGAHRDETAIGAFIDLIERRTRVGHVRTRLVSPSALCPHPEGGGQLDRRAVHHGGVDHLAFAGSPGVDQRRRDAEGQQHSTATHVADQVQWGQRTFAGSPEVVEDTRDGDVVDVVARGLGKRSCLSPAGHACIHQAGIADQARVGADSEAFGDPRPESLGEDVRFVDQAQQRLAALFRLQIDFDRAAPPMRHVAARVGLRSATIVDRGALLRRHCALYTYHLSA